VLAVSLREKPEAVARFRERFGVRYPLALDPTGRLSRPFNIQAVPTYFILDRGRVVRFQGHQATADEWVARIGSLY
jgi:hypothetical protein